MGESKLPSSSFCVRVFFALSHCSKVILKFINKTEQRYSVVWAMGSVKHWIGLKPKTKNKRRILNYWYQNKREKKVLVWSWTLDFLKEGQLMCFRHSFLWTIWCLSIITFCQDLGKGVVSATERCGHIHNMVHKHHEELRESLVELWHLLWSILVISLVCFFLVKLILPFFSMLLTCFGN